MILSSMQIGPAGSESICVGRLRVCGHCFVANAEKRCSNCKCVYYCSRECQAKDYKTKHKALCGILKLLPEWESQTVQQVKEEISSGSTGDLLVGQAFDLLTGKLGFFNHVGNPDQLPVGPEDTDEGIKLMKEAACAGNKAAQYMMALNCLHDEHNEDECLHWIKLAAHNNHAQAQITYGSKYWLEQKNGHPRNPVEAITWMRRALEKGVSKDGNPDPQGNFLSRNSFLQGINTIHHAGRNLYLETFENTLDSSVDMPMDVMKLAADCGCVPAINHACKDKQEN